MQGDILYSENDEAGRMFYWVFSGKVNHVARITGLEVEKERLRGETPEQN
jgi:hypothetical protein